MTVDTGSNNVLSLVGILIDRYREAATILNQRKTKCAEQRSAPPSRVLEENIDQAPAEIEKEKSRGIARFGDRFEFGDNEAVDELREIIAHLQKDLLDGLNQVADVEDEVDYNVLADAADVGRDSGIESLLALKRRLMIAEGRKKSIASDDSQLSAASKSPASSLEVPRDDAQTAGGADGEDGQPHRSRSGNLLSFFKHHRERPDSEERSPARQHRLSNLLGLPLESTTPRSNSKDDQPRQQSTGSDNERNPIGDQTPRNSTASNETLSPPRASMTSSASSDKAVPLYDKGRTRSGSSMNPSVNSAAISALQPNPDNNYLGFCKGAARLQNGDRQAMQRTREFNDGWSSSSVHYLLCSNSKCVFASHLDLNSIWTKVWLIEEIGLKFRWPFLAKSHVCQTKQVKQSEYTYQCMFCVFTGNEATVIDGTDSYLEHISEAHRGQALGDVVLYRTTCVADRVCEDDEEFDINLFPLTDGEAVPQEAEANDPAEESIAGPRLSEDAIPLEPVETKTPWCEDMPEFHPTDTLEAIERQFSIRSFRSISQL